MRLIIQPDLSGISEWAANYIVASINKFAPTATWYYILSLPTGSTQKADSAL